MRAPRALPALALASMLAVIAASAFIRLSSQPGPAVDIVRAAHRVSASLAGLLVLLLAAHALWRRVRVGAALAAFALTLFLAALGRAAGSAPPPPAALGNLAGGLALAALLAWLLGRARPALAAGARERRLALAALGAAALQCAFGAWMTLFVARADSAPFALAHAATGIATGALAAWLGVRLGRPLLALLAGLALAAGTATALLELPPAAALAHPFAVALLLCALAELEGRLA